MNMGAVLIREIMNQNWTKAADLARKFVWKSPIVLEKVRRHMHRFGYTANVISYWYTCGVTFFVG